MENTSTPITPAPKKSMGSVIAIIIIVLLIAVGGLYFWGKQLVTKGPAVLPEVSTSDEVQSINNDASINVDSDAIVDTSDLDALLK